MADFQQHTKVLEVNQHEDHHHHQNIHILQGKILKSDFVARGDGHAEMPKGKTEGRVKHTGLQEVIHNADKVAEKR